MSFWTSFSSKRRPMRRFTAKSVFLALVTAWRLAGAPTRISSLSAYATIEGVVRAPSLFSMTLGLPPSMIATQELVVPRSMPMIFAMFAVLSPSSEPDRKVGFSGCFSSACGSRAGLGGLPGRHHHQRGPDDAVVQQVALAQHRDDGVGRLVGGHLAHGLVAVRVELLARGVDLGDARPLEG